MWLNEHQKSLVEQNLNIVKLVVRYMIWNDDSVQGLGYDDLYQTGCEALCHAALDYDPGSTASFATFAKIVIRNKLIDHCRRVNRLQFPICYLDSPAKDTDGLTYGDILTDSEAQKQTQADTEIFMLLSEAKKDYSGITQKGIDALYLRCMGYSSIDIAAQYGVKANHVSAWISRAGNRLKKDSRFTYLKVS